MISLTENRCRGNFGTTLPAVHHRYMPATKTSVRGPLSAADAARRRF